MLTFFLNYCTNLKLQNYKYLNCPIATSGRRENLFGQGKILVRYCPVTNLYHSPDVFYTYQYQKESDIKQQNH